MVKRKGGWLMKQTWEHLLFLHLPVPVEDLREKIPSQLELDTFDGEAWIGIVPFAVNHMRVHGLPEIPFARSSLNAMFVHMSLITESRVFIFSVLMLIMLLQQWVHAANFTCHIIKLRWVGPCC